MGWRCSPARPECLPHARPFRIARASVLATRARAALAALSSCSSHCAGTTQRGTHWQPTRATVCQLVELLQRRHRRLHNARPDRRNGAGSTCSFSLCAARASTLMRGGARAGQAAAGAQRGRKGHVATGPRLHTCGHRRRCACALAPGHGLSRAVARGDERLRTAGALPHTGWQMCDSYRVMPSNSSAFHDAQGAPIVRRPCHFAKCSRDRARVVRNSTANLGTRTA